MHFFNEKSMLSETLLLLVSAWIGRASVSESNFEDVEEKSNLLMI